MKTITKLFLFILLVFLLLTPVFASDYISIASTDVSVFEGKTYRLVPYHTEQGATFSFASDNTAVAPVDPDGTVRAIAPGTAKITITENLHGTQKLVNVTIKDKGFVYAVYVPPTEGYATSEQYAYMKEAGINTAIMHGFVKRSHMEASLAAGVPHGIRFYVSDDRLSGDIFSYSEETIRSYVRDYKGREGVYGYYLKDEPIGANPYAVPYRIMASEDPDSIVHLNFYPMNCVEQFGITYDGYVDDWVALVGPEYKHTISFDNYPFNNNIYNEQLCMAHFEHYIKYARKHDVDLEYFVQSCGLNGGFNSNDASVRYHFSIGMAYGVKSYQYFTWFTPLPTSEPFIAGSAIMTSDGKKGALFDITKTTNANARKVEPYLAPAEAIEVYHTGSTVAAETPLPVKYFFRASSANARAIVSLYYNEARNKYYVLVVNKNYTEASHSFNFTVEGATEVYDLTSGEPAQVSLANGAFSATIEGGAYRLFGFNEGFVPNLAKKKASDNLAKDKPVYVHTSVGKDGFYAMNLTDGDPATAWSPTAEDNKLYALIDLKKIQKIGYITLQADADYPGVAKVSISMDNNRYETISDSVTLSQNAATLSFTRTDARYIKIEIPNTSVHLAECSVYERMPIVLKYQNTYLEKGMTYLRSSGDFEDIQVVCALYENGVMTEARVLSADELSHGDTALFSVNDPAVSLVKTFLLKNSIGSLVPYAEPFHGKDYGPNTAYENFEGDFNSEFWARTVGSSFSSAGQLSGFAYAVGNANPIFTKAGYTFSVDVKAPFDADTNYWMSAPITLRGVRTAASFNCAGGIMLLFQENRVALRTQINTSAWNVMMSSGQNYLSLPFSLKTPTRLIFEDNGDNLITLSYVDTAKGITPYGYIVIDGSGATLYNADRTQTFGTAPASLYGGDYVSVCSHLSGATFDNLELSYHEKRTIVESFTNNYDTAFWSGAASGSLKTDSTALKGFAFSFTTANPINIEKGYTLSMDIAAPYDTEDRNIWMSAGIALRAAKHAVPYNLSQGIMLLVQEDRIGLRTKTNKNYWTDMLSAGQTMMSIPVSFQTARKLVLRDNGYDEIRIMAENDQNELIDLGYIKLTNDGATLYNADKSQSYGTCPASLYAGESHVGVFQHLQTASFDNLTLFYAD